MTPMSDPQRYFERLAAAYVRGKLLDADGTALMEGLYVKVEQEGVVTERYKLVRSSFLQTVIDSQTHWMDRPLVPNGLRPGVALL
jgi:hypothetical protein